MFITFLYLHLYAKICFAANVLHLFSTPFQGWTLGSYVANTPLTFHQIFPLKLKDLFSFKEISTNYTNWYDVNCVQYWNLKREEAIKKIPDLLQRVSLGDNLLKKADNLYQSEALIKEEYNNLLKKYSRHNAVVNRTITLNDLNITKFITKYPACAYDTVDLETLRYLREFQQILDVDKADINADYNHSYRNATSVDQNFTKKSYKKVYDQAIKDSVEVVDTDFRIYSYDKKLKMFAPNLTIEPLQPSLPKKFHIYLPEEYLTKYENLK